MHPAPKVLHHKDPRLPGALTHHGAGFLEDKRHQPRILSRLFGQGFGLRRGGDGVQGDLPSFRLADDFLCDSDDVAVAQGQPRSLKSLADQLGEVIPRLDIGNGWKGQQGSAHGSVDFLADDLNSGVGNLPLTINLDKN